MRVRIHIYPAQDEYAAQALTAVRHRRDMYTPEAAAAAVWADLLPFLPSSPRGVRRSRNSCIHMYTCVCMCMCVCVCVCVCMCVCVVVAWV